MVNRELIAGAADSVEPEVVSITGPMPGSMGLSGLWAMIGNGTAMLLVAVTMCVMGYAAWTIHNQDRGDLLKLIDRGFEQNDKLAAIIDHNTRAIEKLANRIEVIARP